MGRGTSSSGDAGYAPTSRSPGEQLELPFGQPEPPTLLPPTSCRSCRSSSGCSDSPCPAATVGPELEAIAPSTMSALIEKMRAANAKVAPTLDVAPPEPTAAPAAPAVLDVPKEKPSKVKLDVQPHVFTEEGEPVETTGKPKSFGVSNPEVFPPPI